MQPLTPAVYPQLKDFFHGQPHLLSIYSLPSLICWDTPVYRAVYEILDDVLIVGYYCTLRPWENHLILPIAPQWDEPPEKIWHIARKLGFPQYYYVPREYVIRHGLEGENPYFICTEQREYEDYIYKTNDLVQLRGNRYANKRNWITRFLKDNEGQYFLERITESNAEECLAFLEDWCEYYDCSPQANESLACEKHATMTMLRHIKGLDSEGLLVRIKGKVSAFAIRTPLAEDMANLTFEKAFPHIIGLYPFLDRECARNLFSGYEYINKESDMGLHGLAQSKESYHPVQRRKSYCLMLKE
ncbi:MAG: phosphatidylglycerol lysyltransferase domain-containing protein [Syntrophobacterales bacterium]|jgi:hypothetical protein|nr:phosphatidylglycerol lysyltransferase domain-containing protein [Syntrophobacterales bacterium]